MLQAAWQADVSRRPDFVDILQLLEQHVQVDEEINATAAPVAFSAAATTVSALKSQWERRSVEGA
jgi:hypothetical protein